MKVLRTLVLGLGTIFACGCGRVVRTNYTVPATTYGTYMGGNTTGAMKQQNMNQPTQQQQQAQWNHPTQGYYKG